MSRLYPTLQEFYGSCKAADYPDFKSRSTQQLYQTLQRAFIHNPRIYGHAVTRTSALSSFTWNLYCNDKTFEQKKDAMKARVTQMVAAILQYQLRTIMYGAMLIKMRTVTNNATGTMLVLDKVYEPHEFDYDDTNIYIFNGTRVAQTIDRTKFQTEYLFDCNTALPRGGTMRAIMPSEILRHDMILENANYLKKLKGILQIINKGTSTDNQTSAETAAKTAVQSNYVVTDDNLEFKLNEIAATNGSAFKDFIEARDTEIAIAIVGQANTTELPNQGGSRAALQVMKMVSADIFYSDMNRVEALTNQLLLMDYILNYDSKATLAQLPVGFQFNMSEEQEDVEAVANAIQVLAAFMPLLNAEVYARTGFTPPKPGDDVFKPINANGTSL
jgi:hypothetical protein